MVGIFGGKLDKIQVGILDERLVKVLGKGEFIDGLTLVRALVAGLVELESVIMIGGLAEEIGAVLEEALVNESEELVLSLMVSSIELINLLFIFDLVTIPVELCSLFLFRSTLLRESRLSCSTAFTDLFEKGETLEMRDGLEGGVGRTLARTRQIMGDLENVFLLLEITGDELIVTEGERDEAAKGEQYLSIGGGEGEE